jgi:cyanophycinase
MRGARSFVLLLAVACAPSGAGPSPTTPPSPARAAADAPKGILYIVGGGPQHAALVREFVTLAGGDTARIIVFAQASRDCLASGEEKAADLRALGARAINVWIGRAQADDDSVVAHVKQATGIWFGGGDQARLMAALGGSRTEAAMRDRYRAGAVIGGTSAGAAVMSATMLTGDERHPGGVRPDTTVVFGTIARGNVVTAPGFGFTDAMIVDQHFLRRRRQNRLMSIALEFAPHLAVGIDESTALIVEPEGRWRVAGESVAVIYDARHATVTAPGETLGATGVVTHVLPAGSHFDPRSGTATLPPAPHP